jgi:hypothetical protein
VHCGKSFASGAAWLDAEQGGFACGDCRVTWREMRMLDQDDVRNLQAVAAAPGGPTTPTLRATRNVAQAIEALVNHHLGRRPKAGVHAMEFVRGA